MFTLSYLVCQSIDRSLLLRQVSSWRFLRRRPSFEVERNLFCLHFKKISIQFDTQPATDLTEINQNWVFFKIIVSCLQPSFTVTSSLPELQKWVILISGLSEVGMDSVFVQFMHSSSSAIELVWMQLSRCV